jgi:hypothetical protein
MTLQGHQTYSLTTILARGKFTVKNPAQVKSCRLSLEYWGGVVACLNGKEAACGHMQTNRTPQEASIRLIAAPRKPRWHPVGQFGSSRLHPSWRNFLDLAYWNTELK